MYKTMKTSSKYLKNGGGKADLPPRRLVVPYSSRVWVCGWVRVLVCSGVGVCLRSVSGTHPTKLFRPCLSCVFLMLVCMYVSKYVCSIRSHFFLHTHRTLSAAALLLSCTGIDTVSRTQFHNVPHGSSGSSGDNSWKGYLRALRFGRQREGGEERREREIESGGGGRGV